MLSLLRILLIRIARLLLIIALFGIIVGVGSRLWESYILKQVDGKYVNEINRDTQTKSAKGPKEIATQSRSQLDKVILSVDSLSGNIASVDISENSDIDKQERLFSETEQLRISRIALYPLNDAQYRQSHSDGSEMIELVSSLLMIELGQSDQFELLDRSIVSALFTEKSRLLVNDEPGSRQSSLKKLPISDFTLVGSLFSTTEGKSYSLKLIRNSTGQIIGSARFNYTLENISESIQQASALVQEWLTNAPSRARMTQSGEMDKLSFGHFTDIGKNDSHLNHGRLITENLIEKFVNQQDFLVLSRTQNFPLVFEEILRSMQYTDENQQSRRANTNYFIHGKYRFDPLERDRPLSIYLYLETINYDRELIVIRAKDWDNAYVLIDDAVVNFLPKPVTGISPQQVEESHQLFLNGLRTRGMLYEKRILSGKLPPTLSDFRTFADSYKPANIAPTRKLIEQSLQINPHNQASKLAMAMFYQADGDLSKSVDMMTEVSRSRDLTSVNTAYSLLREDKSILATNITPRIFEGVVGKRQATAIHRTLIEEEYLLDSGITVTLNRKQKLDAVFNRSSSLLLGNLDPDTSVKVFEKLRSIYYYPTAQVRFLKPRRFRASEITNKRNWSQQAYSDKHNPEALLHFNIASTTSNIHIITATELPSVGFYNEIKNESTERRKSNLETAIDGFSSSVFLDSGYLRAIVLLGYSLCQPEVNGCASAKVIHSWIVDNVNTSFKNVGYGSGYGVAIKEEDLERDHLIFLAADSVDRVDEATLSDLFRSTLAQENYHIKKLQARSKTLLANDNTSSKGGVVENLMHTYAQEIRTQCLSLTDDSRKLHDAIRYRQPMEDFATLAEQSEAAALLRQRLLSEVEIDCPMVYPFFIINIDPALPFVEEEQVNMIHQVATGKTLPIAPGQFIKVASRLFGRWIESGNLETARLFVNHLIDYYDITEETAMDFSYLYHRIGDTATSNRLMKQFGKDSFRVENFTLNEVDGKYAHNGFEQNGQLRFIDKRNSETYFIYRAFDTKFGIGEIPAKWRIKYKKGRPRTGNNNSKHPELFAFGNGGKYFGKITWSATDKMPEKGMEVTREAIGESIPYTQVSVVSNNETNIPKNSIERLFLNGFSLAADQQIAIKGLPKNSTFGPLEESHFPKSFSRYKKIKPVMQALFDKGYLTVAGMPVFNTGNQLREKIKTDFSGFSSFEQEGLLKALTATYQLRGAGKAQIHNRQGNNWALKTTLIPDDASDDRHFGSAVAIHGVYALVCDSRNGLYSFKNIDQQWVQQQRIEAKCSTIAMNNEWAIVGSLENAEVYKNDAGFWIKSEVLMPKKYIVNREKKGYYFRYYGSTLAILDNTIIVGNPSGGKNRRGEVYIYELIDNKWQQTEILHPNKTVSQFGETLFATNDYLVIGDPSTGENDTPIYQSGSVFVYVKRHSKWQLKTKLVAKNRPKYGLFGRKVLIKNQPKPELLIQSRDDIYRYVLLN